jgi:Ca-activated chloride channel family protein
MIASLVSLLFLATQPIGLRVEVASLGKGTAGTVVGIALQVAPEDRARAGTRVRVGINLARQGRVLDSGASVVELAADGSALIYREWSPGEGALKVTVESLDQASSGAWSGKVTVAAMEAPFEAPAGAAPEAVALAAQPPAQDVVRFIPPDKPGGVGGVQLEVVGPSTMARVEFHQDGTLLFERHRAPWTVSVKLGETPRRTTIRAQGFTADGAFLGEDAVVLNAPSTQIPVELLIAPEAAGGEQGRPITIAVGRGARFEDVILRVDDEAIARWNVCPCVTRLPEERLRTAKVISAEVLGPGGTRGEAVHVVGSRGFKEAVRVEVVELPVTVIDAKGALVPDLHQDAFRVFEDDREVEIEAFSRTAELPLQMGLLVDVSGSMVEPFGDVRRAVAGFAKELVRGGDTYFLMTFSWETKLSLSWTGNTAFLEPALERVTPDGGTSLHDALVGGLEQMRGRRGRTALVILSDGDDTTSRTPWDVALRYLKTMRTPIFPIGFKIGLLDFTIRSRLKEMADATGGEAFFAPSKGDLAGVYQRIGERMRAQYLLTYRSPSNRPPDQFRVIRVEIAGEGLRAKTLAGYFPTP